MNKIIKLNEQVKTGMAACLLSGFVVHLFAFTNLIPNSDGISRVYELQQMTISGRWFLHYASMPHAFLQAPSLIGALTLIFMAMAAGLMVDGLVIKNKITAAFCGIFLVVFPAVTYNNLYIFTASAYAIGVFLAVMAVWVQRNHPKWWPLSALVLACAIGIYQAYLAMAAAFALTVVILDFLDEKKEWKKSFTDAVKMLVMLLVGTALYFIILKIFLEVKNLELWSYRGIETMGLGGGIEGLITSLAATYKEFIYYFIKPGFVNYISTPFVTVHIIMLMLGAGLFLYRIYKGKLYQEPIRMVLLIGCCGLIPMGFNTIRILSPMSPNMQHSFVWVYFLLACLVDCVLETKWRLKKAVGYLFTGTGLAVLLLCAQIANTAYISTATAHRATQTYASNLVGRVESTEGYKKDMEVVIIGSFPEDVYYNNVESFKLVEHYSCLSSNVVPLNKHIYYYLNDWINVPWEQPAEDLMIQVSDSEEFKNMPLYPDDGSVKIIDGRVVVKVAENYTPKNLYEIQYENRH